MKKGPRFARALCLLCRISSDTVSTETRVSVLRIKEETVSATHTWPLPRYDLLDFGIVPVNGSGEIIVFPLCFSLVRTSLKEAKGHTLDCVTKNKRHQNECRVESFVHQSIPFPPQSGIFI